MHFNTLTMFILITLWVPCGRKLEHPEKTHDFRWNVDGLFSHESVARIEPTNSEVTGACSEDYPSETPIQYSFRACGMIMDDLTR